MSVYERMLELSSQGFACSQIMMQLVLDAEGKKDPDLLRTMAALTNGMRDTGLTCGALTGGACVISYYAAQGEPFEAHDPHYDEMIRELYEWFTTEMVPRYGGISCPQMLGNGTRQKLEVCPPVVEETFNKALELLDKHDLLY